MIKPKRIIGVLGGMGPYSSAHFYKLLLKKSSVLYGVVNNDEFPEILIDSVPVPDFISNMTDLKKAKEMLLDRVVRLNNFGVTSIGLVCNTAHILYRDLSTKSEVKFYSMIDLVANEARKQGLKRVCILATPTTIKFDLYRKALLKVGIKGFYPNSRMVRLHERVIRNMVAGKKDLGGIKNLETSTNELINSNNLDGVILGCTELPLVFPKRNFNAVVDCMEVLADRLLEKYYN